MFGDVNNDGVFNKGDTKSLMNYLFGSASGAAPAGLSNADANGDGTVDVADVSVLMQELENQPAPTATSTVYGDVNGDGVFDQTDGQDLMKHLFGGSSGGQAPSGLANADTNGDGTVDISDAVQLMNALSGQGAAGQTTGGPNSGSQIAYQPNLSGAIK